MKFPLLSSLIRKLRLAKPQGRLIRTRVFTSSGTYTPTPGTTAVKVVVIGEGGSGGNVQTH